MKLLFIALFVAILAQTYANTCTTRRVCVRQAYRTRACYWGRRKHTYRVHKRVPRYRTACHNSRRSRKYCGFVKTRQTKCVYVNLPRYYYVRQRVTRYRNRRVCRASHSGNYWNRKSCTQCRLHRQPYYTYINVRKCRYYRSRRCSTHHVRVRRCNTRYYYVRVCRSVRHGWRTISRTFTRWIRTRKCSVVTRYRNTFRNVRTCKPCAGVPTFYNRIFYRSAAQAKARAIQRCRNADLFSFYSCVFDRANGELNAKKEALRLRQLGARKRGYLTCKSWGDPHIVTFSGKVYNVYNHKADHQLLYQSSNIIVRTSYHYSSWGKRAVNRVATVQVGGRMAVFKLPCRTRYRGYNWNHVLTGNGRSMFRRVRGNGHYAVYQSRVSGHTFDVVVHGRGYIDVIIKAPTAYAAIAKGQCNIVSGVRHGGVINMAAVYQIPFKSACARKRARYNVCKTHCRNASQVIRCMQDAA